MRPKWSKVSEKGVPTKKVNYRTALSMKSCEKTNFMLWKQAYE